MKKEKYESAELELIAFTAKDVLFSSGYDDDDEYEGWNPGSGGSGGEGYEGWNPH